MRLLQPVEEHRGDARPLVGATGLLLDDRGQGHHFGGRGQRHVGAAAPPDLVQQRLLVARHFLQQLVAGVAALELVGFRQQRALARDFADIAGQRRVVAQFFDDLPAGEALGNGQRVQDGAALHDLVDDVLQRGALLEQIFARLELAAQALDEQGDREGQPAVDHALVDQDLGNVVGVRPRRDHHRLVGGERPRQPGAAAGHDDAETGDHRQRPAGKS